MQLIGRYQSRYGLADVVLVALMSAACGRTTVSQGA